MIHVVDLYPGPDGESQAAAATMAKPMLLTTEIKALMDRLHMAPVLPSEDSTDVPATAKH